MPTELTESPTLGIVPLQPNPTQSGYALCYLAVMLSISKSMKMLNIMACVAECNFLHTWGCWFVISACRVCDWPG
jgi:hypothetical protein